MTYQAGLTLVGTVGFLAGYVAASVTAAVVIGHIIKRMGK